jgi:hypothetical protein
LAAALRRFAAFFLEALEGFLLLSVGRRWVEGDGVFTEVST